MMYKSVSISVPSVVHASCMCLVLGVDSDFQAQHQAHAAGVDDARDADADRLVHHVDRGPRLQRPANLQLDPETGLLVMSNEIERYSYDVVVIGAGGSGLR